MLRSCVNNLFHQHQTLAGDIFPASHTGIINSGRRLRSFHIFAVPKDLVITLILRGRHKAADKLSFNIIDLNCNLAALLQCVA